MTNIETSLRVDAGSGFDESQTIRRTISEHVTKNQFDIDGFNTIDRVRYHLAQEFVILKVHGIIIYRRDGSLYELDYFITNAVNNRNHVLSFSTKHPFIEVRLFNQEIKRILFHIEYLLVGEASLDHLYKSIKNDCDDALYDERLKREKTTYHVTMVLEDQQLQLSRLQNKMDAREVSEGRLGILKKTYLKKRFEWLRPIYHWFVLDKRKSYDKWLALPALTISTLAVLINKNYKIVHKSGLFDCPYYHEQNPDLKEKSGHPITHYFKIGCKTGKNPNPLFWTSYYLEQNPEIMESGVNPLVHYLLIGAKKGINPCPLFNTNYYMDKNPDIRKSGTNPLLHYISQGCYEGKDPHPLFETEYYLRKNPDVVKSNMDPLSHYIRSGFVENRDPGPFFDTAFYAYHRVQENKKAINPLAHYIKNSSKDRFYPNRHLNKLRNKPKISIIVPVFKVETVFLLQCIRSVLNQIYLNWELCLVDDGSERSAIKSIFETFSDIDDRIKIKLLPQNIGVSGAINEGVALATGQYISFLDHDDELTKDALLKIVLEINRHNPDVIYTDEDIISESGTLISSWFKPDFSPDLLYSFNYITHFLVLKKELFYQVGQLSSEFDGAQDYDLILKLAEHTEKIGHITEALYRWRSIPQSTSATPEVKHYADDAGKLALETALKRRNICAKVIKNDKLFYYRVKRSLIKTPLISIVIPFKDGFEFLIACIHSILNISSYDHFEIIGINNKSKEKTTLEGMSKLERSDSRVSFYDYNVEFNYSKINNFGVGLAKGDHIVFMNSDIEVISIDWIETLLEHSQRKEVGAVGAKLYYPDKTIQHAGIILGIGGFAGHSHRFYPGDDLGYFHRLKSIQNVSAVTAALMMVKTRLYQESGGMDEEKFSVALNDVDFCMRLRRRGYLNVFTPFCQALHHESVSRGYEETPAQKRRFFMEIRQFKNKWKTELANGDPYYNPNLTLSREDFSAKKPKSHSFV